MVDAAVSAMEVKSQLKSYSTSLKKFHLSPEQFFALLHERNRKLEEVESEEEEEKTDESETMQRRGGFEYLVKLPIELKILVLQLAGPGGFFNMMQCSKQWLGFLGINK